MDEERPPVRSSRFLKLAKQFRDKEFRDTYVAAHTRRFLARQMRKFRGDLSQMDFAGKLGKQQTIVSRLENPNYSGWTLSTLLEIANKLNVGLIVRFVDFPSFLKFTDDFSESAVHPESYRQEEVDDFARIEAEKETLSDLQLNFDANILVNNNIYESEGVVSPQLVSSLPMTFVTSASYGVGAAGVIWSGNSLLPRAFGNIEISQMAALKSENTQLKNENEELRIENKRLRLIAFSLTNPVQGEPFLPQKGELFPVWSQQSFGGAWQ